MDILNAQSGPASRRPSALRIAANRRNAQKSTGPKTAAGKRRAALNARVKDLFPQETERQLRARGEDVNEFRRLHRDLIGIFHPRDVAGERVVARMAVTWWEKARRIRQWVAAGEPRCDDLDARLEDLLVLMARVFRGRHEHWVQRLAGVVGARVGSPANVRGHIERRLYVFGGRKRDRKYYRMGRDGSARDEEMPPEFVSYVERVLEKILGESATKAQGPAAGQPASERQAPDAVPGASR